MRSLSLSPSSLAKALTFNTIGGGLAAATALRLRDQGHVVQPSALLLNIPWLARPPKEEANITSWNSVKFDRIWSVAGSTRPILELTSSSRSLANAQFAAESFFPSDTVDLDKYAFAADHPSLHGLPPTIISVSELDILRDSGVEWAMRIMRDSENGAELHVTLLLN